MHACMHACIPMHNEGLSHTQVVVRVSKYITTKAYSHTHGESKSRGRNPDTTACGAHATHACQTHIYIYIYIYNYIYYMVRGECQQDAANPERPARSTPKGHKPNLQTACEQHGKEPNTHHHRAQTGPRCAHGTKRRIERRDAPPSSSRNPPEVRTTRRAN